MINKNILKCCCNSSSQHVNPTFKTFKKYCWLCYYRWTIAIMNNYNNYADQDYINSYINYRRHQHYDSGRYQRVPLSGMAFVVFLTLHNPNLPFLGQKCRFLSSPMRAWANNFSSVFIVFILFSLIGFFHCIEYRFSTYFPRSSLFFITRLNFNFLWLFTFLF